MSQLLAAHEPHPALALDRHWSVVAANAAVAPLIAAADPDLLKPPINVMRLSLHPRGLAPLIINLAEWRAHLIERLRRQLRMSFDPAVGRLLGEVGACPAPIARPRCDTGSHEFNDVAVPLRLRSPRGPLSFLSCVAGRRLRVDVHRHAPRDASGGYYRCFGNETCPTA